MEIKDASTGKPTVGPDPARQNSSNQKTSSDNCRIEASNACKEAVERVETKVKQYVCACCSFKDRCVLTSIVRLDK